MSLLASSSVIYQIKELRGKKTTGTQAIKVGDLIFEVRIDLKGRVGSICLLARFFQASSIEVQVQVQIPQLKLVICA